MQYLIAALIGLVSGTTSGLFGVGGGIVMVPAMMFFMKFDIKVAVGTSLAVIIPTALSGAFKHWQLNNISWPAVVGIAPAAVAGGYLGAWLTSHLSSGGLKRAFGGLLLLVGLKLLFGK